MIEDYLNEIKNKRDVRANLSRMRAALKQCEQEQRAGLLKEAQLFFALLCDSDPKVRKNTALLLGDLSLQQAAEPLFTAYRDETVRFVKSAYLKAMQNLDMSAYRKELERSFAALQKEVPQEDEKKHTAEELNELRRLVDDAGAGFLHTFTDFSDTGKILLTANKEQREVVLDEISELPVTVKRKARLHPLGVLVQTNSVMPFARLRTYRELLFPLPVSSPLADEPKEAAKEVWEAGILELLNGLHTPDGPYYFRLDLKSRLMGGDAARFTKKFCLELQMLSGGSLFNAPDHYEVQIRLAERKEGGFVPFLKLSAIPVKRFAYRKHAVSASIHPALAAMLVRLCGPYLKENARVLDPFCGVGTMLIERDIYKPAGELYGTDIFGDAVLFGRENAAAAGELVHLIHRDYFDFKHSEPFDEIITNMPVRIQKSKEETDNFYENFFRKSKEVLTSGGILILYSNECGFIKKQMRLQGGFKLLQEFVIREKEQFHLFILETGKQR